MGKRMPVSVILFLILCFFASCGHLPPSYSTKEDLPQEYLQCQTENSLATSSFQEGEWPACDWWSTFQDPYLSELIEEALASEPSVKIAEARLRSAIYVAEYRKSPLFPHLDFDGLAARERLSKNTLIGSFPPNPYTDVLIQTTLTYELDLWNKNRSLYQSSLNQAQAALADEAQAKLLLSLSVARAYFGLQRAIRQENISQRQLERQEGVASLFERRWIGGIGDKTPLLQAQKEAAKIEQEVAAIHESRELLSHQLMALVGHPVDLEERVLIQPPPFPLPCSLPVDLLSRRADLMAACFRIESAAREVGAAKASFYPNIDLTAFVGLESTIQLSQFFQYKSFFDFFGAAVHLPIFDAGRLQANLSIQWENYEIALENYNQVLRQSVLEVTDSVTRLQTIDVQKEAIEQAYLEARNIYEIAKARSLSGIDNSIEVLKAEVMLLTQEEQKVQSEEQRLQAVLGIIRALGGGYQYDAT